MTIRAVVFDIGGVLEITPDTGMTEKWEARLHLKAGELNEQLMDVWKDGSSGKISEEIIVFLDDVEANVAAARAFGIQAILFRETKEAIAAIQACKPHHLLSHTLFDIHRVGMRTLWKEKIVEASTLHLVLAPDAVIDLQLHTTFSDGTWTPEQLIDYLVREQFGLVAITDHDRVDTAAVLQQLAAEKQFPILAAVEMSTSWSGELTDVLCYGFDPENNELQELAQDIAHRQRENTRGVCENLRKIGIAFPNPHELDALLAKPSAQQPHELVALLKKLGYGTGEPSAGTLITEAGFLWATNEIATVVDAAHRSGAVCLIAHPGRGDGYTCYDAQLLDELRRHVPIDGLEVYYPAHTPEQMAMYREYAKTHRLLTSSGSDSHGPEKNPIKYRAELSRSLLERLGIQIS